MIRLRPHLSFGVAMIVALWCAAGVMADLRPHPKPLTFLPQWRPQAQFAGFYMAQHKGFYREHGLDVTIRTGGPDRSPAVCLKENRTDIATMWLSTALQLSNSGVPVVNVAQIIQRSALMLAVKRSTGIRTPADMNGKKLAVWPADFQIQPEAFIEKYGLDLRMVTTACPIRLFLRDGVEAASLMWYNEYHTVLNAGIDPEQMRLFFFDDHDLNFPEDGIYLRADTFERDPRSACAFAAASLEGWRYAFAHPDEAIDLMVSVMAAAHIPANRVHQRWMLDRLRDLALTADGRLGLLQEADYRRVGDILIARGKVDEVPPYDSFFRTCAP